MIWYWELLLLILYFSLGNCSFLQMKLLLQCKLLNITKDMNNKVVVSNMCEMHQKMHQITLNLLLVFF